MSKEPDISTTSTVSARVSSDLAERLSAAAGRTHNPYAPTVSQIIGRGIELALGEIEQKPATDTLIDDDRVNGEYRRLMALAAMPAEIGHVNLLSPTKTIRTHDDLHEALFGFTLTRAIEDNRLRLGERVQKPHVISDPEAADPILALFRANLYTRWQQPDLMGKADWVTFRSTLPRLEVAKMGAPAAKQALISRLMGLVEPFFGSVALWRTFPEVYQDDNNGAMHIGARFHLVVWSEYATILPYGVADYVEQLAQKKLGGQRYVEGFCRKTSIPEMLERLSLPHYVGCAFVVQAVAFEEQCDGDVSKLPTADFEHRVWKQKESGDLLFVRPDASGAYTSSYSAYERVR